MLYGFLRTVIGWALRLFYRVEVSAPFPLPDGPMMLVGNHPNGLVDPALVFVITDRHVTFLAKEPLFRMPLVGRILKGIGALPVYRKQDDPTRMGGNEGTFEAARLALSSGGAITIFPEGRSHSDPSLSPLKTGAARIAFRAVEAGAAVRVVPVGLTYQEKTRFRSQVRVEVGEPFEVKPFLPDAPEKQPAAVHALTDRIADALHALTLNLGAWEDLEAIETAEAFYALRLGQPQGDPERVRRFAKGMQLLREEQPERLERLREEVSSLSRRLELVRARPDDLPVVYHPLKVTRFVLRNLVALCFGFPVFALGLFAFGLPTLLVRGAVRAMGAEKDLVATMKLGVAAVVFPLWVGGVCALAWHLLSPLAALGLLVGSVPLGLFTRYFLDRRRIAAHDARMFFLLGNRRSFKARLLAEGDRLAAELEALAVELGPRLDRAVS